MLSKSRGQVLRVAAVLRTLFTIKYQTEDEDENDDVGRSKVDENDEDIRVIDNGTVKVAIDMVKISNQQSLFMMGKSTMEEEMQKLGNDQ